MFRKLLAGTDLTPASDAVLSCLGQLKPLGLEEVILTHVVYVAHCPCHRVCASLRRELKRWRRYRKSDLPPPGMHRFDPKDEWRPTGVQANVLMLGYTLSERGSPDALRFALARVPQWSKELRHQSQLSPEEEK